MKKGGRCSAVTLLGANLLRLRPCIEVRDGKMGVGKKYRGSFDKCVCEYIADKIGNRSDHALRRVGGIGAKGCGNCAKVTAV